MQHRKMFSVAPTSVEEEVNDSDHEASDQVAIEPRRSTRICTTPEWYGNPVLDIMLLDNNEPTSYGEAMVGPYSDKWLEAMKSEIGSIYSQWLADHRASPPKSILCSDIWILSRISWLLTICRNTGPPSLLHSL